ALQGLMRGHTVNTSHASGPTSTVPINPPLTSASTIPFVSIINHRSLTSDSPSFFRRR
ncbi:unnamed protein product, partial [Ceratitis capitata]